MTELPALVAFDIDGTLTQSKQPMSPQMLSLFTQLLARTKIALTSGGKLELATTQIVDLLPAEARLEELYLLPTSGSVLYTYRNGTWEQVYKESLTAEEAARITKVLQDAAQSTGIIDFETPSYGERIENRGSQVSLSALGQQAPLAEKQAWDPDRSKRKRLQEAIAPQLPEYDINLGGLTTFDITKHGINKAFGIRKLSAYLSIPIERMEYVGDALFPGGNDAVVKETGIRTHEVSDPDDTATFISNLLAMP